jgi:hypothetical protein
MPFELSQSTKHCEHQPPMRRIGIGPGISQRFKGRPSFADYIERVE